MLEIAVIGAFAHQSVVRPSVRPRDYGDFCGFIYLSHISLCGDQRVVEHC